MNNLFKRILSILCACFCALFSFAFIVPYKTLEASAEAYDISSTAGEYYVDLPFLDYTTQLLPSDDASYYLMYRNSTRFALHFSYGDDVSSVGLSHNLTDGVQEYTDISYFANTRYLGDIVDYDIELRPITINETFYWDYALIDSIQVNCDEFEFNDGYNITNSYPYCISYLLEARSNTMLYCNIVIDFADLYFAVADFDNAHLVGICYISMSLPISNSFFMTQTFSNGGVQSLSLQDEYLAYGYTYTAAPNLLRFDTVVNNAYIDGFDKGYAEGDTAGYVRGRAEGYAQGLNDSGQYTFKTLISAVVDVPINAFRSLFNFDFLGFNVANFMLSLMTIGLAFSILRMLI